jgi:hypothetical protein
LKFKDLEELVGSKGLKDLPYWWNEEQGSSKFSQRNIGKENLKITKF